MQIDANVETVLLFDTKCTLHFYMKDSFVFFFSIFIFIGFQYKAFDKHYKNTLKPTSS